MSDNRRKGKGRSNNPIVNFVLNMHGKYFIKSTSDYRNQGLTSKQVVDNLIDHNLDIVNSFRGIERKKDQYYMYYPYGNRLSVGMSKGHELREQRQHRMRYHNRRQVDFMCRFLLASRKKIISRY